MNRSEKGIGYDCRQSVIADKAGEVEEKLVGVSVGAVLRKTRNREKTNHGGSGIQVRPHTLRGHWHQYWTGPMKGECKLILKWTAPTIIHAELETDENAVLYPVK